MFGVINKSSEWKSAIGIIDMALTARWYYK
jgi:hypothetical protein